MQSNQIQQLTMEELAEALDNTSVTHTLDLGVSIIHTGIHATLGSVTVISTFGDRHAIIRPTA